MFPARLKKRYIASPSGGHGGDLEFSKQRFSLNIFTGGGALRFLDTRPDTPPVQHYRSKCRIFERSGVARMDRYKEYYCACIRVTLCAWPVVCGGMNVFGMNAPGGRECMNVGAARVTLEENFDQSTRMIGRKLARKIRCRLRRPRHHSIHCI